MNISSISFLKANSKNNSVKNDGKFSTLPYRGSFLPTAPSFRGASLSSDVYEKRVYVDDYRASGKSKIPNTFETSSPWFIELSQPKQNFVLNALEKFDNPASVADFEPVMKSLKNFSDDEVVELLNNKKKFLRFFEFINMANGPILPEFINISDDLYSRLQELHKEGYLVQPMQLQHNAGEAAICTKIYHDTDADVFTVIKRSINSDKSEGFFRSEKSPYGNFWSSHKKDSRSEFLIRLNRESNYFTDLKELVLNENGEPVEIISSRPSEKLEGAFEITKYRLSDYPEDMDVIVAIDDDMLTDGKKISEVIENDDGSVTLQEKYKHNGLFTKRDYTQKADENGTILFQDYSYQIEDENGDKILDLKRSFTRNSDNSATTIVNGDIYRADFDDALKTVVIHYKDGTYEFDFGKKIYEKTDTSFWTPEQEERRKRIWNMIKQCPADILLMLGYNVHAIMPNGHNCYEHKNKTIGTIIGDIASLYHEAGHSGCVDNNEIVQNKELVEIYKKEMEEFDRTHICEDKKIISYCSLTGGGKHDTGLDEFLADAIALCVTYAMNGKPSLSARGHYLVKYFPKTVAKIADLAGYNAAS